MVTVIIFVVVLGLLVLAHELGHYVTARRLGMTVEEFGIGFPPRMFKVTSKKTGILYSINWIPLGGFVKIKGENGEDMQDKDSFSNFAAWKRVVVLAAGVTMNFLLAAVLFSVGFGIGLPQSVTKEDLEAGRVRDYKVQIVSVLEGSPAQKAGITLGDIVTKVQGTEVSNVDQLVSYSREHVGETATFEIRRGKETLSLEVPIEQLAETGKGGIGVGLVETGIVKFPWYKSAYKGFETTAIISVEILKAFYNVISGLLLGKGTGMTVSGPVGIAVLTGQVAKLGFIYLLQFGAILSINLAIINFLPFPALDGGRVLFIIIEKVRRKPVDRKIEGIIHTIGFSLLMLLIIVVTFQDVLRYSDLFKGFLGG